MTSRSMERALVRLTSFFVRKPVRDDDAVDRLHHNASLMLLLAFAAGTALQEYVGEPINCWTPKAYPQEHYTQHVNEYCWTHTLRYPAASQAVLDLLKERPLVNFGTAFYRWATLIFVLQAMLFKLPNLVWNYLNRQSGASLSKLRDLLSEAQLHNDERGLRMNEAAQYFHSWLAVYRTPSHRKVLGRDIGKLACLFQGCGRRSGKYLVMVYLSVKILYLVNVVGNFALLTVFLDTEFWRYGITVLKDVIVNGDWHDPVNFPRLLLCDFRLYDNGKVMNSELTVATSVQADNNSVHVVQCVLSVNFILEKLFVLQWFWLVSLVILTVFTLLTWSVYTLCACAPYFFARTYMKSLMYHSSDEESRSAQRFVRNYLREDGIFVLRMVEANADSMVVKELVQHLWDNFQARNTVFNVELTEEIEMMMQDNDKVEEEEVDAQDKITDEKEACEMSYSMESTEDIEMIKDDHKHLKEEDDVAAQGKEESC